MIRTGSSLSVLDIANVSTSMSARSFLPPRLNAVRTWVLPPRKHLLYLRLQSFGVRRQCVRFLWLRRSFKCGCVRVPQEFYQCVWNVTLRKLSIHSRLDLVWFRDDFAVLFKIGFSVLVLRVCTYCVLYTRVRHRFSGERTVRERVGASWLLVARLWLLPVPEFHRLVSMSVALCCSTSCCVIGMC